MEKSKYGHVRISIFTLKISNSDMSGFSFINGKFQFRTCLNFNYGHVRILIFQLQNSKSGHVRISIPDTSGFQFRTRPDFNSGHVWISIFQLQNFKSGRVQISIPDFRFSRDKSVYAQHPHPSPAARKATFHLKDRIKWLTQFPI